MVLLILAYLRKMICFDLLHWWSEDCVVGGIYSQMEMWLNESSLSNWEPSNLRFQLVVHSSCQWRSISTGQKSSAVFDLLFFPLCSYWLVLVSRKGNTPLPAALDMENCVVYCWTLLPFPQEVMNLTPCMMDPCNTGRVIGLKKVRTCAALQWYLNSYHIWSQVVVSRIQT